MGRYRVVQWATGNIGQRALRAVLDRDVFELVGVHAFSPDKVGSDAGALARIGPVGVLATDDVDALIDTAPHCVIYTPRVIDYALVGRLLRAGINVVTTGDFLTGTHHPDERAALDAAAMEGGATFLGTGFEPGFVNVAAGFLSGACRRVYSGYRNGRVVVELAICWTMSDDALDPQWTDPQGFKVEIEGEPRVDAVIRFGPPLNSDLSADQSVMSLLMVGTAMAAVNAIPHVCDAPPGVITPIDLPVSGTRGALVD